MSRGSAIAYLSLGGNLGNPKVALASALQSLNQTSGCSIVAVSDLYQTPAWGVKMQPDYLNCVAKIRTYLTPYRLLNRVQAIENAHGRMRLKRWGARTVDIDIVLFDDQRINDPPVLTIPHVHAHERSFVLEPLLQIAPNIVFGGKSAKAHYDALGDRSFRRLGLPVIWWQQTS